MKEIKFEKDPNKYWDSVKRRARYIKLQKEIKIEEECAVKHYNSWHAKRKRDRLRKD